MCPTRRITTSTGWPKPNSTGRETVKRQTHPCDEPGKEVITVLKATLRYTRYLLATLSTVAFKIATN